MWRTILQTVKYTRGGDGIGRVVVGTWSEECQEKKKRKEKKERKKKRKKDVERAKRNYE